MLCFVLLLTSVAVVAYAQTQPTVYSQGITAVSAGETVQIPVYIKDNPGLMGFMLTFDYDAEVLTPVSVNYGSIISGGLQDNIEGDAVPGSFRVYWSGSENLTQNGILFYISAEVAAEAVGNTEISVGFSQSDTFDEDFNDISLACEPITFSVTNTTYTGYAKIGSAAQDVTAGGNFNIAVNLSELTTDEGIDFFLDYDSTAFEYLSYNSTAVTVVEDKNGKIAVASVPDASHIGTDFITLTFKCKDNAKAGKYDFALYSDESNIFCKGCSNTVYASATSDIAVISAENGAGVYGDTVQIPVSITNNHGIMGYKLRFSYDSSLLEPVSVTASQGVGGLIEENIGLNSGYFDVLWQDSGEFSQDGELFTLSFNVIGQSFDSAQVDISYSQSDTFNESYADVVLDCRSFSVFASIEEGDIDLDSDMDSDDYDLLMAYLAGTAQLNSVQLLAADVNGDSAADAFDLFELNKRLFMVPDPEPFEYTVLGDGTAAITSYTGDGTAFTVPSSIDGYEVTLIDKNAFKGRNTVTSVTVSSGVKTIDNYAFMNCTAMTQLTLSDGLEAIKYGSFLNCRSLTEVTLPSTAKSIGSYAFKDCSSLTKIVIPSGVTTIQANSFMNCNSLTIYGYAGSYAQTYANTNGISFVAIG